MHAVKVGEKSLFSPSLGEIRFDDSSVVILPAGLIGFEEFTRFVLYEREEFRPFKCLVAMDEPAIYFPLINPLLIDPEYDADEIKAELPNLGMNSLEEAALYAIVTIGDELSRVTANLRGPLLINQTRLIGKQIILLNSDYKLQQPLNLGSN